MKLKHLFLIFLGVAVLSVGGYAALGAVYMVYNRPAADSLPFTADFEDGDLEEWTGLGVRQLCCDHSAQIVKEPVRSGQYALQMRLDRADPSIRGSKRAEFRLKSAEYGKTYVYAFSTYLPPDWRDGKAPVTLAQWHNVKDMLLVEDGMSPPLRLIVEGDRISVVVRWDKQRVSRGWLNRGRTDEDAVLWTGPLETGRWNDWVFRVRWSYGENGTVAVWKDDEPIVEYTGPNSYNDFVPPYFKMGVYVPLWKVETSGEIDRRVVYYDAVSVHEEG